MAVPNTGPLGLRAQIGEEFYGNATGSDISIHTMAVAEGFTTPDAFSDFYGYSSVVTVTLNGAQTKTGSPGASGFGNLTFNVNAPSGRGFTPTNATQVSINSGLPTPAFVANFTRTGTSVGQWRITTPDGNYPNDSYALQTSNMSISNPSTPLYNLAVTFSGNFSGTSNSTVFQGSTASINRNTSTSTVGTLWSNNAYKGSSTSGLTVNVYGSGQVNQGANASRTLNSNFSGNASIFTNGADQWARPPSGWVGAPPWQGGSSQNGQTFFQLYYSPSSLAIDPRVSGQLRWNGPFGQSQQGVPITPAANNQFYQKYLAGSGTYTVSLHSNHAGYPNLYQAPAFPYT